MAKRVVRNCLAAACRAAGVVRFAERAGRGCLTILCYHRVLPEERKREYFAPRLAVTPEAFRQHCRALSRFYDVLPLSRAVEAWRTDRAARRPIAALTFDDGYRDNIEYAAPLLAEARIVGTFFAIADLVGSRLAPWYDRVARAVRWLSQRGRLDAAMSRVPGAERFGRCGGDPFRIVAEAKTLRPPDRRALLATLESEAGASEISWPHDAVMNESELRQLATAGHEVGSHSATHELLTQVDDAALAAEVAGSRRTLERRLASPVTAFCYPNGAVDDRVAEAVRDAGYACAVTTQPGRNAPGQDRLRLRRWFIDEERLAGLTGAASATLLRMEVSQVAQTMFLRPRATGRRR